jgi:hypothetical protein
MLEIALPVGRVEGSTLETSGGDPAGDIGASGVGISTPIEANTV